jgi:hypothetical protein
MTEILPDEKEMNLRIPLKSPLGREWSALIKKRDIEQVLFESSSDKMAVLRFIECWLPRIQKAQEVLTPRAIFALEAHQNKVLSHDGIHLNRHTLLRIWQRHAILRYREILSEGTSTLKRYHPTMLHDLENTWKQFRADLQAWRRMSSPFDGSQACQSMIQFLSSCHNAAARGE